MAGDDLTDRERDVLALLRRGLTNNEIAAELGISPETAKDHVSSILHKLHVASREEASYWPDQAPWWARAPLLAPLLRLLRGPLRKGAPPLTKLAGALLVLVAISFAVFAVLVLTTRDDSGEQPSGRWLSLLEQIPDTELTREQLVMNDYERVRQLFDVERPGRDADEQELEEYVRSMSEARAGVWLSDVYSASCCFDDLRAELGFTIADVDADAFVGQPPDPYMIVVGRFDETAVEDAVRSDPSFSDILEEASYGGVRYFHWGYEGLNQDRITTVRSLGQGHYLAVFDGMLYWTLLESGLQEMIDARQSVRTSLAASGDYQLLAETLDKMHTYTAFFSSDGSSLSTSVWRSQVPQGASLDDLAIQQPLLPYVAYASGNGWDEKGQFTAVAIVQSNTDGAAENASRLRTRIREARSMFIDGRFVGERPPLWQDVLGDYEIEQDGRLVVAKLYRVAESHFLWEILPHETLLIHE